MPRRLTLLILFILLTTTTISTVCSSRAAHHKVHNLALYPDRHSWCLPTPIRQEIASKNGDCSPTIIDNVVCLGACFSYSVPRAEDDGVIEPYCDACRATEVEWRVIILNCTHAATGEHYHLPKNVELISNCSCVDCSGNTPRTNQVEEDDEEEDDEPVSDEVAAFKRISINSNAINAKEVVEEDDGQHLKSSSGELKSADVMRDNEIPRRNGGDQEEGNRHHHHHHNREM